MFIFLQGMRQIMKAKLLCFQMEKAPIRLSWGLSVRLPSFSWAKKNPLFSNSPVFFFQDCLYKRVEMQRSLFHRIVRRNGARFWECCRERIKIRKLSFETRFRTFSSYFTLFQTHYDALLLSLLPFNNSSTNYKKRNSQKSKKSCKVLLKKRH